MDILSYSFWKKKYISKEKMFHDEGFHLTKTDIPENSIISGEQPEITKIINELFPGQDSYDPWGDIDDAIDLELTGKKVAVQVEDDFDIYEISGSDEDDGEIDDYYDNVYYCEGTEANEMIEVEVKSYVVEGMDSDEYNDQFTSKSTYLNAAGEINDHGYDRAQKHYRNSKRAQRKKLEIRWARWTKWYYQDFDSYEADHIHDDYDEDDNNEVEESDCPYKNAA